jgi:hypothetical protein
VIRCAFDYGYRDHPEKHNPASGLTCLRMTKKDRRAVAPFTIQEAESLISRLHARSDKRWKKDPPRALHFPILVLQFPL